MPILTVAVEDDVTDTRFSMNEALPAGTKFLRVDNELVRVQSIAYRAYQREDPDPLQCTVVRGVEGTAVASHDVGAELEPHVDAYTTPTPFSVGGAQTMRLLGPFRVNFDASDIGSSSGHVIAGSDIGAGANVVRAWAVGISNWVVTTAPAEIGIGVAPVSDPFDAWTVHKYRAGTGVVTIAKQSSAAVNSELSPGGEGVELQQWVAVVAEPVKMYCRSPRTPTAGAIDIYALIAEPAA